MKHDEPYTLAERRDDAAYVGELLGPWERIVDCRRLHATIVALEEALKELEGLRERCAEEARAHARHDLGLEVLKANSIGLAVRKVPLTEPNEKGKEGSDV